MIAGDWIISGLFERFRQRFVVFLAALVPPEQPGLGEPESAAAAGVRPFPRVDPHVKLDVSELPEANATDLALVRLLPRVDPPVPQVVRVEPEGLPALLACVWFFSRVLQSVGRERLTDDESLSADVAGERPFSRMDPEVVLVGGFVEEGPAALAAGVLHVPSVDRLVSLQRSCRVEAFVAEAAAERRHVDARFVPPVDNSAVASLSSSPPEAPPLIMTYRLVFLQLAVVQKSLSAEVTHERLRSSVQKHVSLQLVVLHEALPADLTAERRFPGVDADVSS